MIRLLLLSVLILSGCATAPGRLDPRTASFPLQRFEVPRTERFTLSNGMVVHLLTDHDLPLVSMTAYVRTGGVYDPDDRVGLADLVGTVMRSGGTTETPAEKLDEELEFMASSVESTVGSDVGTVTMTTLRKNLARTTDLFSQILISPAFREDRLDLAKKREIEGLRRQNDDPRGIAERELVRALYGGHPLGRYPTIEGIERVTRSDLVSFHSRFFAPNGVILAVSGDVEREELRFLLENYFGSWQRRELSLPEIPPPPAMVPPRVLYARKDVTQSVIRMGHPGIDKNNPDLYSLRVLDYILGLGFTSRLMNEVRSNQGLAYHVEGYFDVGRRFAGLYRAGTETKSEATVRAVTLMKEIIGKVTTSPVTDQELSLAKDAIINSFVFGFAKSDAVATQRARLEYYGYPEGYLENYRDRIAQVTKEDIFAAARRWLKPDLMTIVVVGNDGKFDAPLSTIGEVTPLTLEIR